MSKTKEYIEDMMSKGIDVLAVDNPNYDPEYMDYLERKYRESLAEMNQYFDEHPELTESRFRKEAERLSNEAKKLEE